MSLTEKEVESFLRKYEDACNSHDFSNVRGLLADDAVYWFSNGSYIGTDEIEKAFVTTWNKIKDETYSISDVRWISLDENSAVCTYQFTWKGIIDGKPQQGTGRGTNVLIKHESQWSIIHEHLSVPKTSA
jgi:uncharacterized protein (TIGR02246 family)